MPSIIALAVLSAITASAAPHGQSHFHLHPARSPRNLIANVDSFITPIAGRSDGALSLDLVDGTCGGSTGHGCADGFCCSKWGYCGVTEDYCGAGCQLGNCNGTATGPTTSNSNATAPEPAAYSSAAPIAPAGAPTQASGPIVTLHMTVTAGGSAPAVTETTTSEAAPETVASTISGAGIATKAHGGPPSFSQSWEPISAGWGQPQESSAAAPAAPTTFATQVSSAPAYTPESSSAAAPAESSSSAPAYSAPASSSASSASAPASTGSGTGNVYKLYSGDGTSANGWPTQEQWMDFDSMWTANLALIGINCDNSDEENNNMKSAIQSISSTSGVPSNYILAIIMQESKGCVRVQGTNNGVGNPGLMQSHNGKGSCNGGSGLLNPCPMSEITQMISDGTEGTLYLGSSGGDGLQQLLTSPDCTADAKYYQAARMYNSGSVLSKVNLLFDATGTPCYTSDIANRLMGWTTAETACHIPVGAYSG